MLVTRKAEYAIRVLVDLARHQAGGAGSRDGVSSAEVAARQGIPPSLIAQIVARLGEASWVQGSRGPGGGIRLIRDPATIDLATVLELMDGPLGISRCLVQEGYCENQGVCPLQKVWARAQRDLLKVLADTTIAQLAWARPATPGGIQAGGDKTAVDAGYRAEYN